jgi:hypothetical protein
MPMHPSTQVTHMPENGLTAPSVLFFVSVAAVALSLVSVISSFLFFLSIV